MSNGILRKYKELIHLPSHSKYISLGEGDTPLIPVTRTAEKMGGGFDLFVKYEGLNPTGSFKDRGMVAAISEALGRGAKTVICASTGNTSASAAAYASRAGIKSSVIIPKGKVARGKLAAAIIYGAEIEEIEGTFDDALEKVKKISTEESAVIVNSINPYRLEGQKTAAFEIFDELGKPPDWVCLPVGNAGNITSYALGFKQYCELKKAEPPKLLGVQAAGASPLVSGKIVPNPETVASAIRIGNPARGEQAAKLVKEVGGKFISVTDKEILNAQKELALEGIWVEPASAASLAGFKKQVQDGEINPKGLQIVLVCTGHGLKDPDIILEN